MSLKTLEENIKDKKLQGIYLLYGEESYDILRYVEKMKKSFKNLENGINFFVIDKTNLLELNSICEGMSFFGESKLVIIKDTEMSFNINQIENLSNDKLVIIITEKSIDKRTINYKTLVKCANCIEFVKQNNNNAKSFVIRTLASYKIKVNENVAEYMTEVCTKDKQTLINEFRKIVAYLKEGESLTKEIIDKICVKTLDAKMFDLTDYILENKKEKAINLYNDLIASKVYPPVMCIMLFRQFKNIYLIKLLKESGVSQTEIIKELALHPFVFAKIQNKTNNYSIEKLESTLLEFGEYNTKIKTGQVNEILGLKKIILTI